MYSSHKTFWEEYKYIIFVILIFTGILLIIGYITYYIYRINQKLIKSEQRHKIIFQNSSAGIVWKKGYIITDWNNQASKLFGWSANEVIGKSFMDFLIPENEKINISSYADDFLKNNDLHIFTNQNVTKNGNLLTCEWYNNRLPNFESKEDFEFVSLVMDITQKVENEKVLNQQAHYDFLTNLPNRNYFETILEKIYSFSNRNNLTFGLAFIDLDGFKTINDTYGHSAGDFLLQEISKKFQDNIRKEDTISRIGGDEFAFIFHISNENENYEIFLSKLLSLASTPIQYTDNIILQVSASIGVAVYSPQNKATIEELMKQADSAMYEVKRKGKNSFYKYLNN